MEPTDTGDGAADVVDGVPQPHVVRAVVRHMNADHAADCLAIARAASGNPAISSARLVVLDEVGLEFAVESDGPSTSLQVPWRRPIVERADIRRQVAEMSHEARAAEHAEPSGTETARHGPAPSSAAVVALALLVVALVGLRPATAHAQVVPDPTVAPVTTLDPDGRTATDGVRSLSVSQVADLDPAGHLVTVTGSGYDTAKGIYVAFCLVPATNQVPSPCGGGADTTGATGASSWISSDPPDYAEGLARPYGPGGTFSLDIALSPTMGRGLDCRLVRCAIVTRNDHTRSTDRSQDIFVPVSFRADVVPPAIDPAPTTTLPPTTSLPTTTTTTTTTPPAPASELSADGTEATDGVRTLTVSRVADLVAEGETLRVTGSGFDASRGVYVSLCRVTDGDAGPRTCLTGSESASAWVTSDPPDYARDLAVPYGDGGTFEVEIDVVPTIDADTDCRVVECAVVVRRDDVAPGDRSLDLAVPVQFGEPQATSTLDGPDADAGDQVAAASTGSSDREGDGGGAGQLAVALVVLGGALAVGGAVFVRTRRRRPIIGPAA